MIDVYNNIIIILFLWDHAIAYIRGMEDLLDKNWDFIHIGNV